MLKLALLLGAVQSTTPYRSIITNVVCNGKDSITFEVTKTDGTTLGDSFKFSHCATGKDGYKTLATPTKVGNTYTITFNPYSLCEGTPDANLARTYSVDMKMLVQQKETIAGVDVYTSAEEYHLICLFSDKYTLTDEFSVIPSLPPGVIGPVFEIFYDIFRFTDETMTTSAAGDVTAYTPVFYQVSADADAMKTDFNTNISKITLQKKTDTSKKLVLFDYFDGNCGQVAVGFTFYRSTDRYINKFGFKAVLLDNDVNAEYEVVVDVTPCAPGATSAICTQSTSCMP